MKKIILFLLAAAFVLSGCQNGPKADGKQRIMVGTILREPGTGIYSLLFDPATGELSDLRMENDANRPSFIAYSPDRKFLYGFGRGNDDKAWIRSFRIGEDGRRLVPADSAATGLVDFCHVATLDGGRIVAFACYHEGKLVYTTVDENGKFGRLTTIGHDSPESREAGWVSHIHQVRQARGSNFVYVPDLGLDRVIIYQFQGGQLIPTAFIPTEENAGPRHVDFHPGGEYMALVNELDSKIIILGRDEMGRYTRGVMITSINEEGYEGPKAAADIHYSPDGRFLYVSDRGSNTVTAFRVSIENDGSITRIGSVNQDISTPRNFAIDPSGKWLLVANQNGNSIVVYAIDPESGELTLTPNRIEIPNPSCILF